MIDFRTVRFGAMLVAAGFAGHVSAHMYINFPNADRGSNGVYQKSKDEDFAYYEDGAFGPVRFKVDHACGHAGDGWSNVRTKQVAIVVPTGPDTKLVDTRVTPPGCCSPPPFEPLYKELGNASPDAEGVDWGIGYLKPQPDPAFPNVYPIMGQTTSGDAIPRAVVWVGDHPDYNDTDLRATVYLSEIPAESCVKEVQYFFAAAYFCSNAPTPHEAMTAWILGPTRQWPQDRIGDTNVQWAPMLSMLRDLNKKPLPTRCGEGKTIGVYPSKAAIDRYMRPVSVDKNDVATPRRLDWWLNHNH